MTAWQIRSPGSAAESYTVTLDGVDLRLTWRWRPRYERWSLDIADATDAPLRSGCIVGCGVDLLRGVLGRPRGALVVLRTVDPQATPPLSWDGWGVYYFGA